MDLVGQQLDEFWVQRHLAQGGMADVYLAQDVNLQRPVALKVMLPTLSRQAELVARFQREARSVARLQHPNIVQVYRHGLTPTGEPYLAMSYLEGGSLQQRLAHGPAFSAMELLRLLRPIAAALEVAHQAGIVHRDLKPSNILLQTDGTAVLTDLGIAAIQGEGHRLTRTGEILGTPHYMSPEQVAGRVVDGRSDIYALGVILYEMLAGVVPFDAENTLAVLHQHLYELPPPLSQKRPDLALATYQLVDICLRKEPEARFQTAAALGQAMDEALDAETMQRRRTSLRMVPATQPNRGQRPLWIYVLGGVIVLLLLLLGGLALLLPSAPTQPTVVAVLQIPTVETAVTAVGSTTPRPTSTSLPTLTPLPLPTETEPIPTATPSPTASPMPMPNPLAMPTAAGSSPSGYIAFTCYIDGFDQICLVPAAGGEISRLTNQPATDFYPSISPDGATIYFSSRREGNFYVFSMGTDGRNQQRFNSDLGGYYAPAISPDGRQMAVTIAAGATQHVWVMNLDGSNARQLTVAGNNNVDPIWSRDGAQIAFSSDRDAVEGQMAHYLMNADGSNVRKLETGLGDLGGRSDWSPDGQWLAFYAGPSSDRDIYLVATDGSVVYQLTNGGSNLAPSFSPDGDWLAFTSYRDGDAEIYIMRVNGSDVRQLTFNERPDWQPRWGP